MELFTGLIKSLSSQPLKENPNFLTNVRRENPLFPCSLKTWMVEIAHYTEKRNAVYTFFFPRDGIMGDPELCSVLLSYREMI